MRLCLGAVGCAASGDGVPGVVGQQLPLACMAGHEPGGAGALCLSLAMREYAIGSPAHIVLPSTTVLLCGLRPIYILLFYFRHIRDF